MIVDKQEGNSQLIVVEPLLNLYKVNSDFNEINCGKMVY